MKTIQEVIELCKECGFHTTNPVGLPECKKQCTPCFQARIVLGKYLKLECPLNKWPMS